MPVEADSNLSHYRLVAKLGEGGMGVVWRAVDTRLEREVAIKLLPEEFANDGERLARFEREAKLLASLNHGNIAAIYGLEHAEDVHFLVMELVPGENLAQRLARGPIPLEEALEICGQVARALETAHDNTVIHRDLKPANVHVTPEGKVKVLDFGLAKSFEGATSSGDPAASPTLTAAETAAGMILGTAAYMSPEQARGRLLDRRTDVWSFGCLLYECLTGRRAFGGETISDSLAAILKSEPDWASLPVGTPRRVRDLLERCLVKDQRGRQRDMGDAGLELERALLAEPEETPAPSSNSGRSDSGSRKLAAILGAFAVGIALGVGLWAAWSGRDNPAQTTGTPRLSFTLPEGELAGGASLSPDGSMIVYGARSEFPSTPEERSQKLFTRRLDEFESRMVENSYGINGSCFSPDGKWLAFVGTGSVDSSAQRLYKVPLDGSAPPLALVDWSREWLDFVWPSMDYLVTVTALPQKVVRIAADGSGVVGETEIAEGQVPGGIFLSGTLLDERHVFGTVVEHADRFLLHVGLLDVQTGKARVLVEDGSSPHWFPTGHLLFTRHDTLLAVPFDRERLEVAGGPVAIERGLRVPNVYAGARFSLSANGTLLYGPGGIMGARRRLAFVASDGSVEDWSGERRAISEGPVVSADGQRLAVTAIGESGLDEVWVADSGQRALRRLVSQTGIDCDPALFHPDGGRLVYRCNTSEVARIQIGNIDRTGQVELLLEQVGGTLWPLDFWPDGSAMLYSRFADGKFEVRALEMAQGPDGARESHDFLDGVGTAKLSPDGRWVAYRSESSGRWELIVRSVAADRSLGLETPVTTSGVRSFGWMPSRAATGSRLLFVSPDEKVFEVTINDAGVSAREPIPWIETALRETAGSTPLPDGRYLVILKGEEERPLRSYQVVLNWTAEFRRKVGLE